MSLQGANQNNNSEILKLQITCETANLFPLVGCYCRLFTDCTLENGCKSIIGSLMTTWEKGEAWKPHSTVKRNYPDIL